MADLPLEGGRCSLESRGSGREVQLARHVGHLAGVVNPPQATGRVVMEDEVELQMTVPLDSEGFLRRKCPTCEREFKWLANQDDAPAEDVEVYTCPYCGVEAPPGDWFTDAQVALAMAIAQREVLAPQIEELGRAIRGLGKTSGGLISASLEYDEPEEPIEEVVEVDDMRRIDFPCHPSEPVKVLDDWSSPVFCLVCGAETKP